MNVPDRAIIAILPAVSLGFIGGLISTMLQLQGGATLAIGLAGAALVMLAAGSSVFGVKGEQGEKAIVGVLRGGCAVGLYGAMFMFILSFLEGSVVAALLWALLGFAFAGVLTQLRVRERGQMRTASD
jgi:hypothetical protein